MDKFLIFRVVSVVWARRRVMPCIVTRVFDISRDVGGFRMMCGIVLFVIGQFVMARVCRGWIRERMRDAVSSVVPQFCKVRDWRWGRFAKWEGGMWVFVRQRWVRRHGSCIDKCMFSMWSVRRRGRDSCTMC